MLRRVVIADDDKKFLNGIDRALYSGGYQMVTVDHERDVLDTVKRVNPDVIILSLDLFQKNLTDAVAALKEHLHFALVPIFLISSGRGNSCGHPLGKSGEPCYLKKPFSPLDLMLAIERALTT